MIRTLAFSLAAVLWAGISMAQDRPQVVVVNKALQGFAERLLGDGAEVVFPVPEGVDPSFWRPSISDISTVQGADLIFLNGAGFATWIDRVSLPRSRVVNTSARIEDRFIVTQSITHSHGDGGEHSHEGLASYTWLDPMMALAKVETMAQAIVARDLAGQEEIDARVAALRAELTALDAMAREHLSPLQGQAIIATHPRYQYFARRYGLTIEALEWEAGVAPSMDQLAELERLARDRGAAVLIWEAAPPAKAIDAAAALGLKSVVFDPLAGQAASGSYIEAMTQAVMELSIAGSKVAN
ncbi:MAG: metal ABC transporter substrate-binding protein [Pseudomonadota bacterium]